MELRSPKGAADSGTGEDALLLPPDGRSLTADQQEAPVLEGDLPAEIDVEADSGVDAGARAPENGATSPEMEEPLDPTLVQLFLEAKNEVEEDALASELPDIPIQDLLRELVSLSRSLGIEQPPTDTEMDAEPADGEEDFAEPELSASLKAARPSLAGSRRHALHGLLLTLTLVMAIASVLVGADRIISSTGQDQEPTPSVTATVEPGVVVRQVHPTESTLEPAGEATPEPTPTRQPAYVIYTVQRGDTLTAIAAAFGISLDHIIWTNPAVIHDPNLLLVGDKLLIPSVAGLIYHLKPGDVLSTLGRLMPAPGPDDSSSPPQHQPPR